MSLAHLDQPVQDIAEKIFLSCNNISNYESPVLANGSVIVVDSMNNFRRHYKLFDPILTSAISFARMAWKNGIDVSVTDQFYKMTVKPALRRIESAYPDKIKNGKELSGCCYYVDILLLNEAAGSRSRIGEAILACYPKCGIPCGWDEREGVLYLYQPKLK